MKEAEAARQAADAKVLATNFLFYFQEEDETKIQKVWGDQVGQRIPFFHLNFLCFFEVKAEAEKAAEAHSRAEKALGPQSRKFLCELCCFFGCSSLSLVFVMFQ